MTIFPLVKVPQIAVFVTSIVFTFVNIPVVALRFAARRRRWGRFAMSDAALLVALVFTTAMCTCLVIVSRLACVTAGVGWHALEALVNYGLGFLPAQGQMVIAVTQLWAVSVLFTKLSILLLFAELFSVIVYLNIAIKVGVAVSLSLWLVQFIAGLTICLPIWNWWNIPAIQGWCGQAQNKLFVSTSIVHTVTDCGILLLPIPCLWTLQLPVKKRVGLVLMFSGGLSATIVSIGRIVTLGQLDRKDVTYNEWEAMMFSVIEPSIGIWIACTPHISTLLKRQSVKGSSVVEASQNRSAPQQTQSRQTKNSSLSTEEFVAP